MQQAHRRSALHAGLRSLWLITLGASHWPSQAGRQIEEPLSDAVRSALSSAVGRGALPAAPPDLIWLSKQQRQDYDRWQAHTSQQLSRYTPHPTERQEFLQTLWYEARRAGLSLSLVLGLIQIESGFRKFAISPAGARGYMQVMPFWSALIGDGDSSRLFEMQTNLRFGCVILRHYLELERHHLFFALGRYNGSRGQASYPQAVLAAQKRWLHEID